MWVLQCALHSHGPRGCRTQRAAAAGWTLRCRRAHSTAHAVQTTVTHAPPQTCVRASQHALVSLLTLHALENAGGSLPQPLQD